jgi:Mn-dependent DtxR family transcriptional regulator
LQQKKPGNRRESASAHVTVWWWMSCWRWAFPREAAEGDAEGIEHHVSDVTIKAFAEFLRDANDARHDARRRKSRRIPSLRSKTLASG